MQPPRDPLIEALASTSPGDDATLAPDAVFPPPEDGPSASPSRLYLLVVDGDASRLHYLAPGEVVVGRGEEAGIRLSSGTASRRHARIHIHGDQATLEDLGSHNGTRVNGERLSGRCPLAAGDVIAIAGATLLFQHRLRARRPTETLSARALRDRLEQEIERGVRYGRDVGVASILSAGTAAEPAAIFEVTRFFDVVGRRAAGELAVILPDLAGEELAAAAGRILRALPGSRIGLASCPGDALDADTLLQAANASALAARPGSMSTAASQPAVERCGAHTIVLADPLMLRIAALLRRLAATALPLLLEGEIGVGKRTLAAAIHHWSDRTAGPLVEVDCPAMVPARVEVELFGGEARPGLLRAALGGTLVLRDVFGLPLSVQERLVHLIDASGTLHPTEYEGPSDVRVIATTPRPLEREVARGRFLGALAERLALRAAVVPPLRDRPRDITVLARYFAHLVAPGTSLGAAALRVLADHDWPENVLELRRRVERAARAAGATIDGADLLPERAQPRQETSEVDLSETLPVGSLDPPTKSR